MNKRLIINADDFGWTRGISDGILLAFREGILTSTSLMVNQPASEYAVELARQNPTLGLGVHLNLCDGSPVLPPSEIPTLINAQGNFLGISELRRRLWRARLSRTEMEAEFQAQIRWLKDRGRIPDHANTHHHVHFHPVVAGPFRRALLAEGVHAARPARQQCYPNGSIAAAHAGPVHRRWLVQCYMDALQRIAFSGLEAPDCRLALHPRYRGRPELVQEAWTALIQSLPAGTYEIECHPGLPEGEFAAMDNIFNFREKELRTLTDPQIRFLIDRNQIELISYGQL